MVWKRRWKEKAVKVLYKNYNEWRVNTIWLWKKELNCFKKKRIKIIMKTLTRVMITNISIVCTEICFITLKISKRTQINHSEITRQLKDHLAFMLVKIVLIGKIRLFPQEEKIRIAILESNRMRRMTKRIRN